MQKQECVSLKELVVTGKDIIELGVPQGKQLGAVLQSLLEEVLENPQHNTKEYLSEKVKQMIVEGLKCGL